MALGFLGTASAIVNIAGGAATIARSFQKPDQPGVLPGMTEAAQRADEIAKALGQKDLGKYGYLIDNEQDAINRESSSALKELMIADRRQSTTSASGRGILPDEQRDEILAREYIRGRETQRERARSAARTYLTGALQANNVALGGYGQVSPIQQGLITEQRSREDRGIEGGVTLANGLIDQLNQANQSKQPTFQFQQKKQPFVLEN